MLRSDCAIFFNGQHVGLTKSFQLVTISHVAVFMHQSKDCIVGRIKLSWVIKKKSHVLFSYTIMEIQRYKINGSSLCCQFVILSLQNLPK